MNHYHDTPTKYFPDLEFLQNPILLLSISIGSLAAIAIMLGRPLRQRIVNILHHIQMHQRQFQIACLCWSFFTILLAIYVGWRPSSTGDVVTFTTENGTVYTADAGEYNKLYEGLAKSLEGNPGEMTVEVTSFGRLIDGKLKNFYLIEEEKYIDDEGRVWTEDELYALPRE
ncbi:hypothetical protein N7513_006667 [Penicillium frequentans]|nr:hypothetical protein N7513_006667 [Penicillium glabrum]